MEVVDGNHMLTINPENSCRLCLLQSLDLQSILESLFVDGYIVSIVDMLAYTLGITVCVSFSLSPLAPVDSLLTFL